MTNDSDSYSTQLVLCSFVSMFLIIIFVISPLKKITMLSSIMKIIILMLLAFTGYLCNVQITFMRKSINPSQSPTITNQMNANIIGEYIFIFLL